jgi:hypothetical protein
MPRPATINWDSVEPRILRLRSQGLSYIDIGKLLDLNPHTIRKRYPRMVRVERPDPVGRWRPSSELIRMRQTIAAAFGIDDAEITSRCRVQHIARARQAACYILRAARPQLSFPCIAVTMGLGDHSTVIHAVRVTGERMARDGELAAQIAGLLAVFWRRRDARQADCHVLDWREWHRAQMMAAAALSAEAEAELADNDVVDWSDEFAAALDRRRTFCGQCDRSVLPAEAARCSARLCGLRQDRAA